MLAVKRKRARANRSKLANSDAGSSVGRMLAAAATLFRTRGYSGTSTRDLAKVLGIQSASLYYHIRRKEDLLYALSVDSIERLIADVEEALADVDDPVERIRALINVHVTRSLADRDKHAAMLFELRNLSGPRRARVIQLRDAYQLITSRTISQAQRAGVFRRDISAKLATLALLNLLNWSIFWYRPGRGLPPEKLADVWTSIFLDGTRLRAQRRHTKG